MSEQISKISKEVQRRVKEIAAMGGESKKRIDTDAEYKELSNLLAGQSGANAKYVKEKMAEYENFVKEKEEQAFLDKVSDAVKKFVADVAASFGDEKKIDSDEEAARLQKMLPNTNGDLSKEDLEYIHRALAEGGYDINVVAAKNDTNMSSGEVKETKTEEPVKSKEDNYTNESTKEIPKKDSPKTQKSQKTSKSKSTKKNSEPQKNSEIKEQPKVLERDAIDGTTRGRKFAEEINSGFVNNEKLARQLRGINSKNAYDFFKQYKAENNGTQDIICKTLVKTSDRKDQLNYRNFLAPVKSLLMQAKSYGLEKTYAYQSLEEAYKKITKIVVTPSVSMDPNNDFEARQLDYKIDFLLAEMGKVVH